MITLNLSDSIAYAVSIQRSVLLYNNQYLSGIQLQNTLYLL